MDHQELFWKLESARSDYLDRLMTQAEYLAYVACIFDGDLDYALTTIPGRPPLRLVLALEPRAGQP